MHGCGSEGMDLVSSWVGLKVSKCVYVVANESQEFATTSTKEESIEVDVSKSRSGGWYTEGSLGTLSALFFCFMGMKSSGMVTSSLANNERMETYGLELVHAVLLHAC